MQKERFHTIIKVAFIIPLLVLALWLIHLIYFPELDAMVEANVKKSHEETTVFRKILNQSEDDNRGHFHMLDEYLSMEEPFKPLCMMCHGTYPHSKEKKVRSILNFHSGYMACATCHVRKEADAKNYFFVWVDRNTGMISSAVKGEFGKYSAKIYPMIIGDDGRKTIYNPVSEKAAEEYLKFKDNYTLDQNAQAKIILHEKISKKPILCKECHSKDGFFKFAELGFPANRVDHLTSTEVTGMIDRYETFYLPSVIDFGAGKSK